jgi:hypothetical protein
VATLTLRNTRGIDILASNADATRSVGIQVKTCQGTRPIWMLNAKAEKDVAENLFYVFVCLPPQGEPSFSVVPRATVATYVQADHKEWQKGLRRDGQPHAPSNVRQFRDRDGEYKDRWDLLGLSKVTT